MSKRPSTATPLLEYFEKFLASRDVGEQYAKQLRWKINHLARWYRVNRGREMRIGDVDADTVNEWLATLANLAAHSVDGYRRGILVVWNDAVVAGVNRHPTARLRRIKKPRVVVQAYTHDEIRKLLSAAARLRGTYRKTFSSVRRKHLWRALIHSAYSTGLRTGDLLAVKRMQIAADGTAIVIQHKTQYPVRVQFSKVALEAIEQIPDIDGRALPVTFNKTNFCKEFKLLRNEAGITYGTFKWLRRSAGSYAEREGYGQGSALLGHRDTRVFTRHYQDWSISSAEKAIAPPALAE